MNDIEEKMTPQMKLFYYERTKKHIERVIQNLMKIAKTTNIDTVKLLERAKKHDLSKFKDPELKPYIWLTEYYRCKNKKIPFQYPEGVKEETEKAWTHHKEANRHHPEYHNSPKDMTTVDIAEMVADWAAMSQEYNNDLKEWVDKNVNKKWHFTNKQTKLIYNLIQIFE